MTDQTKKPYDLDKFSKSILEAIGVLANEVNGLKESKKPEEALNNLARACDKIATRLSREAVMVSEYEKPRSINPLVEITAINVCRSVTNAARDLDHGKGIPKAWEDFAKEIKETVKTTESMQRIIAQTGVSASVVLPGTPLTDEEGKPLMEE